MSKTEPLGSAKITVKGQITIPKEVREKLRVKAGDRVFFFISHGRIIITKDVQLP